MEIGKNYTYLGRGRGVDFEDESHGCDLGAIDKTYGAMSDKQAGMHSDRHYFKPLKKEPAKEFTIQDAYQKMQAECGIEVGDTVRVLRKAGNREMGWGNVWTPKMDGLIGEHLTVRSIQEGGIRGISLSTTKGILGYLHFPFFVLELVKKGSKPVKLNDDYSAELSADGNTVTVGCQEIPSQAVLELATRIKEAQDAINT